MDGRSIAAARVGAIVGSTLGDHRDLRSKVDRFWDAFGSGGISNPLEVIEEITYLLSLRPLDDLKVLPEKDARMSGGYIEDPPFLFGQANLIGKVLLRITPDASSPIATDAFPARLPIEGRISALE